MEQIWTITELVATATEILRGGPAQANGRIRDMPNERLVRWYTTIGLVDPPAARRGRVALYGRRHLLQLVAVKRRQAAGRSIAQIQVELTGATDATLETVAALPETGPAPAGRPARPGGPDGVPAGSPADEPADPTAPVPPAAAAPGTVPATPAPATPPAGHAARRFWSSSPAASGEMAAVRADARPAAGSRLAEEGASLVHGLRLAPGVTLLLDGGVPGAEDLAVIEDAARPLLDALARLGLPRPGPAPDTVPEDPTAHFPTWRST